MSDRSPEEELTRRGVSVLLLRWVEELIRLSELSRVLYRSISYTQMNGNEPNKGDERLIQHIRDGLDNLFVEIEETIDRLDD